MFVWHTFFKTHLPSIHLSDKHLSNTHTLVWHTLAWRIFVCHTFVCHTFVQHICLPLIWLTHIFVWHTFVWRTFVWYPFVLSATHSSATHLSNSDRAGTRTHSLSVPSPHDPIPLSLNCAEGFLFRWSIHISCYEILLPSIKRLTHKNNNKTHFHQSHEDPKKWAIEMFQSIHYVQHMASRFKKTKQRQIKSTSLRQYKWGHNITWTNI